MVYYVFSIHSHKRNHKLITIVPLNVSILVAFARPTRQLKLYPPSSQLMIEEVVIFILIPLLSSIIEIFASSSYSMMKRS